MKIIYLLTIVLLSLTLKLGQALASAGSFEVEYENTQTGWDAVRFCASTFENNLAVEKESLSREAQLKCSPSSNAIFVKIKSFRQDCRGMTNYKAMILGEFFCQQK